MKAGTAKLLSTELKLWKSFSIEMNTILLIFIIIVSLGFVLEVTLEMLNLSYRNKPIPDIIADVYPKDRYMIQQRYEAETTWFSLYEKSLGFIITLIVLSFGVFGKLHSWIIEVITNEKNQTNLLSGNFTVIRISCSDCRHSSHGMDELEPVRGRYFRKNSHGNRGCNGRIRFG